MNNTTFVFSLALVAYLACLSGCSTYDQSDIIKVANLPIVNAKVCPDLTNWTMLSCVAPPEAEITDKRLSYKRLPYGRGFASSPITGCFVYDKENIIAPGYQLCVKTHPSAPEKVIFTAPYGPSIRWPCFSPKGDKIAFLVAHRTSRGKLAPRQRLFVAELIHKTGSMHRLHDCGMVNINGRRVVWRSDGESILWVNRNGQIVELDLSSGDKSFHEKVDVLLAATRDNFLGVRKHRPLFSERGSWILLSISRKDGSERVIARIDGCSTPCLGLFIPGTSILSLVVDHQIDEKTFSLPTIFIDTVSGTALGKTELSVDGYVTR